jgi:putative acyl-CoA dehydrogenase
MEHPPNEVFNQPPELGDLNLYTADPVVSKLALQGWNELRRIGAVAGSRQFRDWGFQANRFPPELQTFDRFGRRIDHVEFHPAWHELMATSVGMGITSLPHDATAPDDAHLDRAVRAYLVGQVEQGHMCPVSMTYAVVPALRKQPDVAARWERALASRVYDPAFRPPSEKQGVLMGMGMTERQGGSDVRANSSIAVADGPGGPGGDYRITGHKWFCSAPMNDAFLVLAQAPGGLSCFLLPRWTPDSVQNSFRINRLKDKLGNRSNASAEVEFESSWAQMIGEEGRGVSTIIEMVNATRLDCVIGAAAIMRQAVTQAVWHVAHRSAFGADLIDQPLMQNVIADIEIEAQAATALMVRLATSFDRAGDDDQEALIKRILTPVAKYWVTKRCSEVVREATECLGGGGYVEDSIMPRLYRESPLNAIWEGSGNVIALDVLRVLNKEPGALDALLTEIEATAPENLVAPVAKLREEIQETENLESVARRLVERLGMLAAASALTRTADPAVSDAYIRSRVGGDRGSMYGTLPALIDAARIAKRAYGLVEAARI